MCLQREEVHRASDFFKGHLLGDRCCSSVRATGKGHMEVHRKYLRTNFREKPIQMQSLKENIQPCLPEPFESTNFSAKLIGVRKIL
jgi:hypothetical protein